MRRRLPPWLVRAFVVALAAATAYGVVAVALQVPLGVVHAGADDLADEGHHAQHHHRHDLDDGVDAPASAEHDHFDCCLARVANAAAPAIEATRAPAPVAAAIRPRWHPRVQPSRPRPWRASLGRDPPRANQSRLAP